MSGEAPTAPIACQHQDWKAQATVIRLTDHEDGDVLGWTIDLTVTCVLCFTPMIWKGMIAGSSPREPMCSFDGTEARLPCSPSVSECPI